jgi:acid phosphatase (class A)
VCIAQVLAPSVLPQANGTGQVAHLTDESRQDVAGYMKGAEPNYLLILPPYPVLGSHADKMDVANFKEMQVPDGSARWKLAEADEEMTYARFGGILGVDLDVKHSPIVVHLLDRMERDVMDTAFQAKSFFNRPRPFQRFQVAHVCGADSPPIPETNPQGGSSYPSGHAAFGWALALTLAEIAPDQAQAILTRGREYAESRVICGVHFPSDVVGGEIVATAVVERLHANADFEHDLACAKEEVHVATNSGTTVDSDCSPMEKRIRELQDGEEPAK